MPLVGGVTDPLASGALLGLTLSHTHAHVWRILMEAIYYVTRACVDGSAVAGHGHTEIIMAVHLVRTRAAPCAHLRRRAHEPSFCELCVFWVLLFYVFLLLSVCTKLFERVVRLLISFLLTPLHLSLALSTK